MPLTAVDRRIRTEQPLIVVVIIIFEVTTGVIIKIAEILRAVRDRVIARARVDHCLRACIDDHIVLDIGRDLCIDAAVKNVVPHFAVALDNDRVAVVPHVAAAVNRNFIAEIRNRRDIFRFVFVIVIGVHPFIPPDRIDEHLVAIVRDAVVRRLVAVDRDVVAGIQHARIGIGDRDQHVVCVDVLDKFCRVVSSRRIDRDVRAVIGDHHIAFRRDFDFRAVIEDVIHAGIDVAERNVRVADAVDHVRRAVSFFFFVVAVALVRRDRFDTVNAV